MNDIQKNILKIIRCALTDTSTDLPDDFDLAKAGSVAKKHGITTMLYYGALKCGVSQDDPLMAPMFISTCQSISQSEQQISEVGKIYSAFDKSGIDYMPLKGVLLKSMYSKAEMRSMGDVDILIKTEQYGDIKPVMEALGYKETEESDHELIWNKGNIYIELHKRLIPSYNKDYYAYFGDGWRLAKLCEGTRYSMTDEDQMIYLFTHFAKHYRDAGIGLRHIIDLWVYRKNKHDLDEAYIKNELVTLKLYDFYINIINTLDVWFEGKESDLKSDFITDYIFGSGVYGTKHTKILSTALRGVKSEKSLFSIKAKKLFESVFLPYGGMCKLYPFLSKCAFLLPFMWVYRVFERLFTKNKLRDYNTDTKIIEKENIDEYQAALNFVGLDFNFKE